MNSSFIVDLKTASECDVEKIGNKIYNLTRISDVTDFKIPTSLVLIVENKAIWNKL
ncbi:hypothetical protein FACS1894188_05590 [Clostridia bacterium]|nr:hypothetical protein FACS1894188_05590 [Clostridia bacterium]